MKTLKMKKPVSYMKLLRLTSDIMILFIAAVMVFAFTVVNFAASAVVASWLYSLAILAIAVLLFVRTAIKYLAGYFNEKARREAFKDSAILAVEDWLIKSETKIQYPLKLRVNDVESGDKSKETKIKFLNKSYVVWNSLKATVHTSDNSQKWEVVLDQAGNIRVKVID